MPLHSTRVAAYYSFGLDALERAVKTAAQTALVTLGAEALDVFSVDWLQVAGMAAGGAVLSALTSVASSPFGPKGAATVVDTVAPVTRAPGTPGADTLG